MDEDITESHLTVEERIRIKGILARFSDSDLRLLREDLTRRQRRDEDLRALWWSVIRWGTLAVLTALVGVLAVGLESWARNLRGQ